MYPSLNRTYCFVFDALKIFLGVSQTMCDLFIFSGLKAPKFENLCYKKALNNFLVPKFGKMVAKFKGLNNIILVIIILFAYLCIQIYCA